MCAGRILAAPPIPLPPSLSLAFEDFVSLIDHKKCLNSNFVPNGVHCLPSPPLPSPPHCVSIFWWCNMLLSRLLRLFHYSYPYFPLPLLTHTHAYTVYYYISVNDFLEYSKVKTGQLKVEARPARLREIFHEAMEMMMQSYPATVRGKGLTVAATAAPSSSTSLRLKLAESVPEATVFTDSVRLQQVTYGWVLDSTRDA